MDTTTHDELSIMLDQEEYDDISMAESLISENQRDSELTVQVFLLLFFFNIFANHCLSICVCTNRVSYFARVCRYNVASFDQLCLPRIVIIFYLL